MPHLRMPQGLQHLIKGPDGIRHTGLEHIVGIHQQRGIVGIDLAVGLECLILAVEHLDPGMGHGATAGTPYSWSEIVQAVPAQPPI